MTDEMVEVNRISLSSEDSATLSNVVQRLRELKIQYGEQSLPLISLRRRVEKANLQLEELEEQKGPELERLEKELEQATQRLRDFSSELTDRYSVDLAVEGKVSLDVDSGCFVEHRLASSLKKKAAKKKVPRKTSKKK